MSTATTRDNTRITRSVWFRILIFLSFLWCANLLAGYIAVNLHYASLYNVKVRFWEYAAPFPLNWGFAHWPSMLIYGIPLIFLPRWSAKRTKYFRIFCVCSFLVLLLEFDEKIPFLLFPKVDSLTAFLFSLAASPPDRKNNPLLVATLKVSAMVSVLSLSFVAYSSWQHRIPTIAKKQFLGGVFLLKEINVKNDFHKDMGFEVDLKVFLPENQACALAQTLASDVLLNYPFDNTYNKIITVTFNPTVKKPNFSPYRLGEISLNEADREKDGRFACYLKYRRSR